jgi:hypothetical protein
MADHQDEDEEFRQRERRAKASYAWTRRSATSTKATAWSSIPEEVRRVPRIAPAYMANSEAPLRG